jgi:unconventional prefoldin RPB5 interactor 1
VGYAYTDCSSASRVTNAQDTTDQLSAMSKKYLSPEALESPEVSTEALMPSTMRSNVPSKSQTSLTPPQPASSSKKVSFAAEPEVNTFTSLPAHTETMSTANTKGATIAREPIYHPTERILELDDHDQIIGSRPLELIAPLPEDDAALHQGATMGSLGPIVAEMNLMGPVQDDDTDSDDEEGFDDDTSSLDENDIGMTNIGRLITDDYRAEMEALMKKHEAALKSVSSVGGKDARSHAGDKSTRAVPQKAPEAVDESDDLSYAEEKELKPFNHRTRKGVRFSNDVDVSPAPAPIPRAEHKLSATVPKQTETVPFSEAVIERVNQPVKPVVKTSTSKPSRFKAGLKAAKSAEPVSPSDNSAQETVPPILPEDGQPKKVSRFKAARLGGT